MRFISIQMAFKTLESKEATDGLSADREEKLGKETTEKWMGGEGESARRRGVCELKRRKCVSRHIMEKYKIIFAIEITDIRLIYHK